jgi:hypothetical protein
MNHIEENMVCEGQVMYANLKKILSEGQVKYVSHAFLRPNRKTDENDN